jgi:hypothetical protein
MPNLLVCYPSYCIISAKKPPSFVFSIQSTNCKEDCIEMSLFSIFTLLFSILYGNNITLFIIQYILSMKQLLPLSAAKLASHTFIPFYSHGPPSFAFSTLSIFHDSPSKPLEAHTIMTIFYSNCDLCLYIPFH